MERRRACLAMLLLGALLAISLPTRLARADEARSVGYVLNFRLGVEAGPAKALLDELAKATSEWHGREAHRGEPVQKNCARSRACVREAARALGVSRLGIVAIVSAGGVTRLDVRLIDANTGAEIQRTNAEYESEDGAPAVERAIFDLIPRLLPGEKAAPVIVSADPEVVAEKPTPKVPPVTQISQDPIVPKVDLRVGESPRQDGPRWWLWGGIGAAATVTVVATFFILRDDTADVPVLELPPPQ